VKIAEVVRAVTNKTTDASGHVASYGVSVSGKVVAYLECRLETQSRTQKEWKVRWTVYSLSDDQRQVEETGHDLPKLLTRFGEVELAPTSVMNAKDFFARSAAK
jgi:hypothetical protein